MIAVQIDPLNQYSDSDTCVPLDALSCWLFNRLRAGDFLAQTAQYLNQHASVTSVRGHVSFSGHLVLPDDCIPMAPLVSIHNGDDWLFTYPYQYLAVATPMAESWIVRYKLT